MTTMEILTNPFVTAAIGMAAGSVGGLALGFLAGVIRNDKKIQAAMVPPADYWEFVYRTVKEAEAAGNDGAHRLAFYMDKADKFLDEAGVVGDAKRVDLERLKRDAATAVELLGFNRKAQAASTPAAS